MWHQWGWLISWIDQLGPSFIEALGHLEQRAGAAFGINSVKALRGLISDESRMAMMPVLKGSNLADVITEAERLKRAQWIGFHFEHAPPSVIHPSRSVPPLHLSECFCG